MQDTPRHYVVQLARPKTRLVFLFSLIILFHNALFQYLLLPLLSLAWLRAYFAQVQTLRSSLEFLLIFAIFYLTSSQWQEWWGRPWKFRSAWLASCLTAGILLLYALLFSRLFSSIGPPPLEPKPLVLKSESLGWLLMNSVLLAPLREELFFRGWLWQLARQHLSLSRASAILFTGLLFTLAHLPAYAWLDLSLLLILGCLLGFVRDKFGLSVCVFVHMLINLLVLYLDASPEGLSAWLSDHSAWKTFCTFLGLSFFLRGVIDLLVEQRHNFQNLSR